jgi:hypothetical protein
LVLSERKIPARFYALEAVISLLISTLEIPLDIPPAISVGPYEKKSLPGAAEISGKAGLIAESFMS